MSPTGTDALRDALRRALTGAIKGHDSNSVTVLRSTLAAIENAEAVAPVSAPTNSGSRIAGSVKGVGAGEARRRALSDVETLRVVHREVQELQDSATFYDGAGQPKEAAQFRAQARVLQAFLQQEV